MLWIAGVGPIQMTTPPYQIKGRFRRFSTFYVQKEMSYIWQKTWWNNTIIYGDLVYYMIINTVSAGLVHIVQITTTIEWLEIYELWVIEKPFSDIYMDIVEWYWHIFSTLPGPFSLTTPIAIYCAPFTVVGRIGMAAIHVFPTIFHIMWTEYYT